MQRIRKSSQIFGLLVLLVGGGIFVPHWSTMAASEPADSSIAVNSKAVAYTTAQFKFTTATPKRVYLQYGVSSTKLVSSTAPDTLGTKHSIVIAAGTLVPGQKYYYVVVTKDASGVVAQSSVQSFITKGQTVLVSAFNASHQPLRHTPITLHSAPATATTDDTGHAIFSNVMPGEHQLTYMAGAKQYSQSVSIKKAITSSNGVETATTQNVTVVYGSLATAQHTGRLLIAGAAVGIILIIALLVANRYRKQRQRPVKPPIQAVITSAPTDNESLISTLKNPLGPQPGSMITPKDDADSDNHRLI